uniref:Biotinidase n=1 Tax=Echeneis naucrates TaxID=173247 RepID=A0A665U5W4_ECHNA
GCHEHISSHRSGFTFDHPVSRTTAKEMCLLAVWLVLSVRTAAAKADSGPDSSYVAAVYEHTLILNPDPQVRLSRTAALRHVHQNLDIYDQQAARAAQQGAQILVFPEDGLQGFNFSRSSISGYLETIPDPEDESWNPCTEPQRHNNTEVHGHFFRCYIDIDLASSPVLTSCSKSPQSLCWRR